jgi:hypothetical protein
MRGGKELQLLHSRIHTLGGNGVDLDFFNEKAAFVMFVLVRVRLLVDCTTQERLEVPLLCFGLTEQLLWRAFCDATESRALAFCALGGIRVLVHTIVDTRNELHGALGTIFVHFIDLRKITLVETAQHAHELARL